MTQMTSLSRLLVIASLAVSSLVHAQETFPQPEELQPDVDFWVSIFSRYSSDEGVLHDNRHLGVVYKRLDMPASLSRRERQQRVAGERKQIQAVLRTLASGKRNNLTDEEARILALWPADVSNETLQSAIARIRYQQGLSDRFRAGLERAGLWRDYVNAEFAALGIPPDLAALPHVESSYNPDARSHVGASGIWQFTRSTGQRFMRVDHVVDERNDPFAATRAAGRLLAYNYSLTGNWPMAITAYNHGLAGVRRAMRQYGDDAYVDILREYNGRTFGFASRNFYVAFLAAREIDQNPEKYFPGVIPMRPVDYVVAELPAYVAVTGLSDALGITPAEIANFNPGLQATIWQGSKYVPRGYQLRLPSSAVDGSLESLLANLPGDSVFSEQLPDMFHTVVRGDTLSEIAETYDTRVSTLVALNTLSSSHSIRAGQRLRLPAAGPAPESITAAEVAAEATQAEAELATAVAADVAPTPIEEEEELVAAVVEDAVPTPIGEMEADGADGDIAAAMLATIQTALLTDPSDYSVAEDGTIEVQSLETLGHFGDWLEIKTQRLRDLNGLAFRTPVEVGQRIKLDLGTVDAATFEQRRTAYHRAQQDSFFRRHTISGVTDHTIQPGESVWVLALRTYDVPLWLLRQYNPNLDLANVRPGTTMQMPVLADVGSG